MAAVNVSIRSLPFNNAAFVKRLARAGWFPLPRKPRLTGFDDPGQAVCHSTKRERRMRPDATSDAIRHVNVTTSKQAQQCLGVHQCHSKRRYYRMLAEAAISETRSTR